MNIDGKLNNQLTLGGKLEAVLVLDGTLQTQLALTGNLPSPLLKQGQIDANGTGTASYIAKMLYAGFFLGNAEAEAQLVALLTANGKIGLTCLNTLAATGLVNVFAYSNFASNNSISLVPFLTLNAKNNAFGAGTLAANALVKGTVKGEFSAIGAGTQAGNAFIGFKGSITTNGQGGLTAAGSIAVTVDGQFAANSTTNVTSAGQVFNSTTGDYRIFVTNFYNVEMSIDGIEWAATDTVGGLELGEFNSYILVNGIDIFGSNHEG